jgi:hypothetical protein
MPIRKPGTQEVCARVRNLLMKILPPDKIDSVVFEFDPRKSESNKAKHGIDFIEAQTLWRSKTCDSRVKDWMVGRDRWTRRSTALEIETYAKIAG